jgi:hypothetical protein
MVIATCNTILKGDTLTVDLALYAHPDNKKKYLLQRYGICCKCTNNELKYNPNVSNKEEILNALEASTSSRLAKQIFWSIAQSRPENIN